MQTRRSRALVCSLILALSLAACKPVQPLPPKTPADRAASSPLPLPVAASASPDGRWLAEVFTDFPPGRDEYYRRLTIRQVDGAAVWTPVEGWSALGLGYTVPRVVQWSTDGSAMYYTHAPMPDGCALFANGSDLVRLDLQTGDVEGVLPPVAQVISLAPDATRVAYIGYGPAGAITVRSLASGEEHSIPLPVEPDDQIGSIVWSPSGDAVALAVAHAPCTGGWTAATSVLVVDLVGGRATVLLSRDSRLPLPAAWPSLESLEVEMQKGSREILDPNAAQ